MARSVDTLKTLDARTPGAWRRWLAAHHDREREVWLVFHKVHTGRAGMAYHDALDEALCFGWIDSLVRRLDDERYARKFTPRKPDSLWSAINRKRYAALKAEGRLQPAGLARAPGARGSGARPATGTAVPAYIADALDARPKARRAFDGLPPSHRRMYVLWIDSAKREETKQRRLQEAIRLLTVGRPLGLK